jgi:thiamine pyrophosphokinase
MHALVFANGEPPSAALAAAAAREARFVVTADGGVEKALALGLSVDAVVGDFDSASESARARLPGDAFHHRPDPSTTDLQKALVFCFEQGATSVDIIGAGGGRADHALANLSMLALFRGRPVRIVDDFFEVSLVDGHAIVEGEPGTVVSLVAIGPCAGVTTSGLRWDMQEQDLVFSPRGVHNEIARSPATVSVRAGDLLLFRGRWVEKHR